MNKNESKYANTAIRMNKAMLTLLENKDFAYITVSEICKAAGVNRSTFYLHYQNTSELLSETVRYILNKHLSYYDTNTAGISLRLSNCSNRELMFITAEYLSPYLTFVKDNQRIFKTSVKQFDAMGFDETYEKMFRHIFSPILTRFRIPEKQHAYIMKFYLSGIFAVVMEWLSNDCRDSTDDIAKIIIDCILGDRSTVNN